MSFASASAGNKSSQFTKDTFMKNRVVLKIFLVSVIAIQGVSGGVPHLFWVQRDIQEQEIKTTACKYTVLIASRKSDYKEAIVQKIVAALISDSICIRITGLKKLKKENEGDYHAVVLINTCMGWGIDIPVKKFLRRSKDPSAVIVYTTAAGDHWKPAMRRQKFDAVTSTSKKDKTDLITKSIVDKIMKRLAEKK
jgi:hypothetical protein